MIYMEPASLGWKPLMISWLNTFSSSFNDEQKQLMIDLFEYFCPPLISFVSINHSKVKIFTTKSFESYCNVNDALTVSMHAICL